MNHQKLVDALRDTVEKSKGRDVELAYNSSEAVVARKAVTNLEVTFADTGGNCLICLSNVRERLLHIDDIDIYSISIDLFGKARNEVAFEGRVGSRVFKIAIRI